jgi:hypothetical protein
MEQKRTISELQNTQRIQIERCAVLPDCYREKRRFAGHRVIFVTDSGTPKLSVLTRLEKLSKDNGLTIIHIQMES